MPLALGGLIKFTCAEHYCAKQNSKPNRSRGLTKHYTGRCVRCGLQYFFFNRTLTCPWETVFYIDPGSTTKHTQSKDHLTVFLRSITMPPYKSITMNAAAPATAIVLRKNGLYNCSGTHRMLIVCNHTTTVCDSVPADHCVAPSSAQFIPSRQKTESRAQLRNCRKNSCQNKQHPRVVTHLLPPLLLPVLLVVGVV